MLFDKLCISLLTQPSLTQCLVVHILRKCQLLLNFIVSVGSGYFEDVPSKKYKIKDYSKGAQSWEIDKLTIKN